MERIGFTFQAQEILDVDAAEMVDGQGKEMD